MIDHQRGEVLINIRQLAEMLDGRVGLSNPQVGLLGGIAKAKIEGFSGYRKSRVVNFLGLENRCRFFISM